MTTELVDTSKKPTSRIPGYALVATGLVMALSTVLTWWTVTGEFLGLDFDYTVPGVGTAAGERVWEGLESAGAAGSIVLWGGILVALVGLVRALGKGGRLMGVLALVVALLVTLLALMHLAGNSDEVMGILIEPAIGLYLAIVASFVAFLVGIWATIRR